MKIFLNDEGTKTITKSELNKITRRALEKNIVVETCGKMFVSKINGNDFCWQYRRIESYYMPVCKKEDANLIAVYSYCGKYLKGIIL